MVRIDELKDQVHRNGIEVEQDRLKDGSWQLEPKSVTDLIAKLRERGASLAQLSGVKPYYGIKTGLNEAFLIDTQTKNNLCRVDPRSQEIIKPYLHSQDLQKMVPKMDRNLGDLRQTGHRQREYPAIKNHLEKYRPKLEPKPSSWGETEWTGRKAGSYQWFELQDPVDYWEIFESKKILYPDITWRQNFCYDESKAFPNNQ